MTPRSLTEAEVRYIVERTASLPSGRQASFPSFRDVDIALLQRDLTSCAYWYLTAQRVKAKGHHTAQSERASKIKKAAQGLLGLISDDLGRQCVGEFPSRMVFPVDVDPLDMDASDQFDVTLLAVYLTHLQQEASQLVEKIGVRRSGFGLFPGSATNWLVGTRLTWIFEKRFGRKPGISKHRTVGSDGTELAPVGGAYVRFVTAALEVFRQSHGIDLRLQPDSIADAFKTGRQGGVRKRGVRKR